MFDLSLRKALGACKKGFFELENLDMISGHQRRPAAIYG